MKFRHQRVSGSLLLERREANYFHTLLTFMSKEVGNDIHKEEGGRDHGVPLLL